MTAYNNWKLWAERNPEKRRAQKRRWYVKNAARISAKNKLRSREAVAANRAYFKRFPEKLVERSLKHRHGLTLDDYRKMQEAQNNKCAICGIDGADCRESKLHVDHCHETKEVRGLLCELCNRMLGHAKDKASVLIAGAVYLNERRARHS